GHAIALCHDIHRHLAGTETVGLGGAGQLLQAGVDFVLDRVCCQRQGDASLQLVEGLHGDSHVMNSLYLIEKKGWSGARGGTRTPTPLLASGSKPGASTNFATRASTRIFAGQSQRTCIWS